MNGIIVKQTSDVLKFTFQLQPLWATEIFQMSRGLMPPAPWIHLSKRAGLRSWHCTWR